MYRFGIAYSTRSRQRRSLFLAIYLALILTDLRAAEIWVVTDARHPMSLSPGVRIIELDAPARIAAEISAGLPSNPARARAIAEQRLRDSDGALQRRLAAAYQGVVDAWSLGITKVPAVVVDRHFIIYGTPDANQAVALIEQYRNHHP